MNAPFPAKTTHSAEPIADKPLIEVDARLALLERAATRCMLVELREIDLEQGFDELIGPLLEIIYVRPQNDADAHWDSPSWRQAALEYHEDRKRRGRR